MKEKNIPIYSEEDVKLILSKYESATRIYRAPDSYIVPLKNIIETYEEIKPKKS